MNHRRLILTLAIVAAIGLLIFWFRQNFEQVEQSRHVGMEKAALRNPLLAAEQFLRLMGLNTNTGPELIVARPDLPANAILIIDAPRVALGESGHQRLLDWVADGGHLIIGVDPEPSAEATDPILDALDIGAELADENLNSETPVEQSREAFGLAIDYQPLRIMLTDRDDMQIAFADENGYHLLEFAYRKGSITLFSDLRWLRNEHIGEYDHARFLHRLVTSFDNGKPQVLLTHDLRASSLLDRLLTRIPLTFVAIGVGLILLLMRVTRRFGPPLPTPTPERRQLVEHIEASGYYLWSKGFASALLDAARQRVKHKLYQLWPEMEHLANGEQHARIAEITRLPTSSVELALFKAAQHKRESFTRQVRLLEQLRKRL